MRNLPAVVVFLAGVAAAAVAGSVLGSQAGSNTALADSGRRTPARGSSGDVTEAEAVVILGRALPVPVLPHGFARTALTADADEGPGIPRLVRQSFAAGGRNVALLTLFRAQRLLPLDETGTNQALADGVTRRVTTKTLADGSVDVGYVWSSDGVAFSLHINLVDGVDRRTADAIAASIH